MSESMTMEPAKRTWDETRITNALSAFADVRADTMRMVSGLTEAQANFAPNRDTWSIGQNLDHLLRTEDLYRTQMARLVDLAKEGKRFNIDVSLQEVDLSLPFVPRPLMPYMAVPLTMFNLFVPAPVRETFLRFPVMKAKNPRISEPSAGPPIAGLLQDLRSSLEETKTLLSGPLPANVGRVTVSHPVLGCNTIANILGLIAAHEQRHGAQIRGVTAHRSFPRRASSAA